jgi:hypothetical protein
MFLSPGPIRPPFIGLEWQWMPRDAFAVVRAPNVRAMNHNQLPIPNIL